MWWIPIGALAGLLYYLFSQKPRGLFALAGKRFSDGWEVYILSRGRKGRKKDDLDALFSGPPEEEGIEEVETVTANVWFEYVAVNKLESRAWYGNLRMRFELLTEEEVLNLIHEILTTVTEEDYRGPKRGAYIDKVRQFTLTRSEHPYVHFESIESLRVRRMY